MIYCIIRGSGHCQFLFWIFLISFLFHHFADAVKAFPDVGEGNVERREAQTDIIGCAKIGDDIHLLDHGAVDAISLLVTDADVRAASGRVTRGAEGKAQRRQQRDRSGRRRSLSSKWTWRAGHPSLLRASESSASSIAIVESIGAVPIKNRWTPGAGSIVEIERKWILLSPPAPDRRRDFVLDSLVDI